MQACTVANLEIVRRLIIAGAKCDAKDTSGRSVIEFAILAPRNATELVRALLKAGAEAEIGAMRAAISKRRVGVIKLLATHGASVQKSQDGSYWPLGTAVREANFATVKSLIDLGADIQATETIDDKVEGLLNRTEDIVMIDLLLESGLKAGPKDNITFSSPHRDNGRIIRLLGAGAIPSPNEGAVLLGHAIHEMDLVLASQLLLVAPFAVWGRKDRLVEKLPKFIKALSEINPALPSRLTSPKPEVEDFLEEQLAQISISSPSKISSASEFCPEELPEALRAGFFPTQPAFPPRWASSAYKAPMLASGKPMPDFALDNIVRMMQRSTFDQPHAAISDVLKACDRQSLAEFAWSVFQDWANHGGGSVDWIFQALGHFGDDACARRLTPFIREWPRVSTTHLAKKGLDLLNFMASDEAVMQIQSIALKNKYVPVQKYAQGLMSTVAKKRGTTVKTLEAILVPTLGLSSDGTMTLDFGSRIFVGRVDHRLRPCLHDPFGAPLQVLPAATQGDDTVKVATAHAAWKEFVSNLKPLARLQMQRVETEMINQDTMSGTVFRAGFMKHPLLMALTRNLVWGTYKGRVLHMSFRVRQDGTCVDTNGKAVRVLDRTAVRIIHPVELDEDQIEAWTSVFKAEKLAQPFAQLTRKVYRAQADAKGDHFGLEGAFVPSGAIRGLRAAGWKGYGSMHGHSLDEWRRDLGRVQIEIGLEPGIAVNDSSRDPAEQKLYIGALPKLDGIPYSELIRELQALRP